MMKIAVVSDDGVYVSQHFGRAMLYVVATVENSKVVKKEHRPKVAHHHVIFSDIKAKRQGKHGYDADSQSKHDQMFKSINDCQVLIAGGMGWGAYESMISYHIETIVTEINSINEAIGLYLTGKLPHQTNRLD
jgi:predicted Fe-Mo cluster-binding NifX family protein